MLSRACPPTSLVGGGDGGQLREIGKHPVVEEIHICEIDEASTCRPVVMYKNILSEVCLISALHCTCIRLNVLTCANLGNCTSSYRIDDFEVLIG